MGLALPEGCRGFSFSVVALRAVIKWSCFAQEVCLALPSCWALIGLWKGVQAVGLIWMFGVFFARLCV